MMKDWVVLLMISFSLFFFWDVSQNTIIFFFFLSVLVNMDASIGGWFLRPHERLYSHVLQHSRQTTRSCPSTRVRHHIFSAKLHKLRSKLTNLKMSSNDNFRGHPHHHFQAWTSMQQNAIKHTRVQLLYNH